MRGTSFTALITLAFIAGCSEQRLITLTTRPLPANVRIDGVDKGSSPVTNLFVFDANKPTARVDVSRAGYKDQSIEITPRTDLNLAIELKPLSRRITINIRPFAATVSINGKPVRNLAHLVALLRDAKDEFIAIAFDQHGGETMVFPRAEMLSATDEILTDNGVRTQGSPDTLIIWNAKSGK